MSESSKLKARRTRVEYSTPTPPHLTWVFQSIGILLLVGLTSAVVVSMTTSAQFGTCDRTVQEGEDIQGAVDAANPGEVICVEADTYREEVAISTDGLTLKPADEESPELNGGGGLGLALKLQEVDDVHIEGFEILNYRGSPVDGSVLSVIQSSNVTIADNNITQNAGTGIDLGSSSGTIVRHNTVKNNRNDGVSLGYGEENIVRGNRIADNGWNGVFVSTTDENEIQNNEIIGNDRSGIDLGAASNNLIQDNIIAENQDGVSLSLSADDNVLKGNTITDNSAGLEVDSSSGLDATENWWGNEEGPAGGVEDACTDTVAEGNGDSIQATDAEICFDPWLTSPNPDAGISASQETPHALALTALALASGASVLPRPGRT